LCGLKKKVLSFTILIFKNGEEPCEMRFSQVTMKVPLVTNVNQLTMLLLLLLGDTLLSKATPPRFAIWMD
jgi:hypothetical protein